MHCVTQPVPNYRRVGLHAITASLTCPSPKRNPLHRLHLGLLLTPVAGTGGVWQQGSKVQRGGMHRKWEEKATAGWSSFEISQQLSQLTVRLCSTHCRILCCLTSLIHSGSLPVYICDIIFHRDIYMSHIYGWFMFIHIQKLKASAVKTEQYSFKREKTS